MARELTGVTAASLAVLVLWVLPGAAPAHADAVRQPPVAPEEPRQPGSVVDQLVAPPEAVRGHHHYVLSYEASILEPTEHVLALSANVLFSVTRVVTVVSLAVVEWAFELRVASYLVEPVSRFVDAAQERLVGPLRLRHLVLSFAVVWCGWQVLTHRAGRGLAELGVSLLLAAASTAVLASPEPMVCTGVDVVRGLSSTLLTLAADDPWATTGPPRSTCPAVPDDLSTPPAVRAFTAAAFTAFVADAHLLLNWGGVPPPGDPCRQVMDELRAERPWGTQPEPRDRLRAVPGCAPYAEFNARMTLDRSAGALLSLVAAAVFFLALVGLACTLIAAQVVGLLLVLLTPFALAAGVAPDLGRQLLARWLLGIARSALVILLVALLLGFFVVAWNAIAATASESLTERYLMGVAIGVGAIVLTKRLRHAGRSGASAVVRRVEAATLAGGWDAAVHGIDPVAPAPGPLRRAAAAAGRTAVSVATRKVGG